MCGMALWALGWQWPPLAVASEVASAPVQVGRSLVLQEVLEEREISAQVQRIREAGAKVYPAIGRLFKPDGDGGQETVYEPTLFLFVRDAGYFYRVWYLKIGPKGTPVVVMALPGGLKEIGLEKLVKP